MGRNGEHGLCELPDGGNQEILNVLRCQHHTGILLPDTLHGIADVLNGSLVGQEQVQLVDSSYAVANAYQPIAHIRQDVEQDSVLQALVGVHKSLYTEAKELVVHNVGVAVEVPTFRADAHGVDTETDLPEHLLGVQVLFGRVVFQILLLAQPIEFRHDRIVNRAEGGKVRAVRNAPLGIQLFQQDLHGVHLSIRKILVAAEKVLKEGNVLAQPGDLPEGFRTLPICVRFFRIHRPYFRLQWVDDVLSGHIVHITAAQIPGQILIFRFLGQNLVDAIHPFLWVAAAASKD